MSTLKENVQKVVDANAAIKSALEAKGVAVPAAAKLSDAAALIGAIDTGLDRATIANAVSAMDGETHTTDETADALAASIKTINRRGERRKVVLTNDDGTEVTQEDIAAMTWDVTPGVNAFAVAVSPTYPDGTERPHGLQFTLGWHSFLSGHTTYSVDWGDGTKSENISDTNPVHTYAKAGVYKIEMSNDFSSWGFWLVNENQGYWNPGVPTSSGSTTVTDGHTRAFWCVDNRSKVVRLLQIGENVTSLDHIAQWCKNLTGQLPDWPDSVKRAWCAFMNCPGISGHIPEWNNITNCYSCYYGCSGLTGRVPKWNESVGSISWCYAGCYGLTGSVPAWPKSMTDHGLGYTYNGCFGLTGSVPAWPEGVKDTDNCFNACSGLTGPIPAWPSTLTNAQCTFRGCFGLTGSVPAWGAAITNAYNCYNGCSGLTGSVPAWGAAITNTGSCYNGCSGLTGSVPAWGAAITNAYQTFYGCLGLTGAIPVWGEKITNAQECYNSCPGLTTVWDESATDDELMPSRITSKSNCFANCDNRLRAFFLTAWGGTRAS